MHSTRHKLCDLRDFILDCDIHTLLHKSFLDVILRQQPRHLLDFLLGRKNTETHNLSRDLFLDLCSQLPLQTPQSKKKDKVCPGAVFVLLAISPNIFPDQFFATEFFHMKLHLDSATHDTAHSPHSYSLFTPYGRWIAGHRLDQHESNTW